MGDRWGTKREKRKVKRKRAYDFTRKPLNLHGPETDKIASGNTVELQDVSSLKNPKYPQKYPHSENILLDVITACWTMFWAVTTVTHLVLA